MKKLIWIVLALFLPCAAIAQEALHSISDVKAMTPEYYDGTCKLDGKRTIDFRAPVFVPDVENMPVVRVTHQMLSEDEAALFEGIERFENTIRVQDFSMSKAFSAVYNSKKMGLTGIESVYNIWNPDIKQKSYQIYAEGQTFSLGELIDIVSESVEKYYGVGFYPFYGKTESAAYEKGKDKQLTDQLYECGQFTGIGAYQVEGWSLIDGIPVLTNIASSQTNQTGFPKCTLRQAVGQWHGHVAVMEWRTEADYWINCAGMLKKTGTVIENIPLCSFEDIRSQLQDKVDREELRYVYAVELGYALYADPETDYAADYDEIFAQEFLLVPVWVAEVSLMRSKTGRTLESFNGPEGGLVDGKYLEKGQYRYIGQDPGYEKLLFNAQTGELLNCKLWDAKDTKMLYPKEIITWEDVQ